MKLVIRETRHRKYGPVMFCIAKTLSDFPLAVLQPVIFLSVIYWIANLHDFQSYLLSVGVLVVNILTTQVTNLILLKMIENRILVKAFSLQSNLIMCTVL